MTHIEEEKIMEIVTNMDAEQKQVAIRCIPIEIIFNELEQRERQRIELLEKLDNLNDFVGQVRR